MELLSIFVLSKSPSSQKYIFLLVHPVERLIISDIDCYFKYLNCDFTLTGRSGATRPSVAYEFIQGRCGGDPAEDGTAAW